MRLSFLPAQTLAFECDLLPEELHSILGKAMNTEDRLWKSMVAFYPNTLSTRYFGSGNTFRVEKEFSIGKNGVIEVIGIAEIELSGNKTIVNIYYEAFNDFAGIFLKLFFSIAIIIFFSALLTILFGKAVHNAWIGLLMSGIFCVIPFLFRSDYSLMITILHQEIIRKLQNGE